MNEKQDLWCYYSDLPSPSAYQESIDGDVITKIEIDGKVITAKVQDDFHYLGGKKVVYVLPNNVTGSTSIDLVKIVK